MAYIMAHVFSHCNNHTALSDTYDLEVSRSSGGRNAVPDIPAVVKRTLQIHRFLTRKTKPHIHELSDQQVKCRWALHQTTSHTGIRYKMPEDVSAESIQSFSVKDRKFNKEV